jgi:hypothetical protein
MLCPKDILISNDKVTSLPPHPSQASEIKEKREESISEEHNRKSRFSLSLLATTKFPIKAFVKTNEGRSRYLHKPPYKMIAAIEWIPAGRANPNPSKYEYSRAEREFLVRMQEQAGGDGEANDDDDDYDVGADAAREEKNAAAGGGGAGSGSDDDWEDVADEDVAGKVDDEDEEEEGGKGGGGGGGGRRDDDNEKTIDPSRLRLPKIDPSSLPADLRMDEYSDDDDDDDDDGVGEKNVGVLLGVGKVWW